MAEKCGVDYCRRQQTLCTVAGLSAPASSPANHPRPEQGLGREGKTLRVWLGTRNPSVAPCLELRVPPGTHGSIFLLAGQCRCLHNTEGPSCERCSPGFYGNPFAGRFDDCKPCPCPDRSPCTEVPGSGEVVCTHCPPGQRGEPGVGQGAAGSPAWPDPPHFFHLP